jgi:hypothetical protein
MLGMTMAVFGFFTTLSRMIANHHDRDLVTPNHENHPLSTQRGERVRVRGVYFHGKPS